MILIQDNLLFSFKTLSAHNLPGTPITPPPACCPLPHMNKF